MPTRPPIPIRHTLATGQTRLLRIEAGTRLRLEAGLVSVRLPMRWLDGAMIDLQARLHGSAALVLEGGWVALTAHAPTVLQLEAPPRALDRLLERLLRAIRSRRRTVVAA